MFYFSCIYLLFFNAETPNCCQPCLPGAQLLPAVSPWGPTAASRAAWGPIAAARVAPPPPPLHSGPSIVLGGSSPCTASHLPMRHIMHFLEGISSGHPSAAAGQVNWLMGYPAVMPRPGRLNPSNNSETEYDRQALCSSC